VSGPSSDVFRSFWNRRQLLHDMAQLTPEFQTDRLLLRGWRPSDLEPFAALNSDPLVMKYFPQLLSREESESFVGRVNAHFDQNGFGLWAVEVHCVAPFIGFVGLAIPRFEAHFTPCVEIGWRLAAEYWNRGYATEAARAVLTFGFDTLQLQSIGVDKNGYVEDVTVVQGHPALTQSAIDAVRQW
jgi:RimJ/RimL family protein N-acetyltransferase